jgi:hypothetical protein
VNRRATRGALASLEIPWCLLGRYAAMPQQKQRARSDNSPTLDEFYNSSDRFWDGWSRSPVNPVSPAGYDPVQLPDLERLIGRLIGPNTGHRSI